MTTTETTSETKVLQDETTGTTTEPEIPEKKVNVQETITSSTPVADTSEEVIATTSKNLEEQPVTTEKKEKENEKEEEDKEEDKEEEEVSEITQGYLHKRGKQKLQFARIWNYRYFIFGDQKPIELENLDLYHEKNVKPYVVPKTTTVPGKVVATSQPSETPQSTEEENEDIYEKQHKSIFSNIAHATQTGRGLLFYYKSNKEQHLRQPHGIINLGEVISVSHDPSLKPLAFTITTSTQEHSFYAENEKELKQWIKTIENRATETKHSLPDLHNTEGYKEVYENLVNRKVFTSSRAVVENINSDTELVSSGDELETKGAKTPVEGKRRSAFPLFNLWPGKKGIDEVASPVVEGSDSPQEPSEITPEPIVPVGEAKTEEPNKSETSETPKKTKGFNIPNPFGGLRAKVTEPKKEGKEEDKKEITPVEEPVNAETSANPTETTEVKKEDSSVDERKEISFIGRILQKKPSPSGNSVTKEETIENSEITNTETITEPVKTETTTTNTTTTTTTEIVGETTEAETVGESATLEKNEKKPFQAFGRFFGVKKSDDHSHKKEESNLTVTQEVETTKDETDAKKDDDGSCGEDKKNKITAPATSSERPLGRRLTQLLSGGKSKAKSTAEDKKVEIKAEEEIKQTVEENIVEPINTAAGAVIITTTDASEPLLDKATEKNEESAAPRADSSAESVEDKKDPKRGPSLLKRFELSFPRFSATFLGRSNLHTTSVGEVHHGKEETSHSTETREVVPTVNEADAEETSTPAKTEETETEKLIKKKVQDSIKHGNLQKQSQFLKTLQTRFFVFSKDGTLTYYTSEKTGTGKDIKITRDVEINKSEDSSKQIFFELVTKTRAYQLFNNSVEDRDDWFKVLKEFKESLPEHEAAEETPSQKEKPSTSHQKEESSASTSQNKETTETKLEVRNSNETGLIEEVEKAFEAVSEAKSETTTGQEFTADQKRDAKLSWQDRIQTMEMKSERHQCEIKRLRNAINARKLALAQKADTRKQKKLLLKSYINIYETTTVSGAQLLNALNIIHDTLMDSSGNCSRMNQAESEVNKAIELVTLIDDQFELKRQKNHHGFLNGKNEESNEPHASIHDEMMFYTDKCTMDIDESTPLMIDRDKIDAGKNTNLQDLIARYIETEIAIEQFYMKLDQAEGYLDEMILTTALPSTKSKLPLRTHRASVLPSLSPIPEEDEGLIMDWVDSKEFN
ncbi:hypothetical protein G9A89_017414 [Geosiphon pyriformis]|nr:hypothetical protein G9A89_017414 [Geosiphon pyriformis]